MPDINYAIHSQRSSLSKYFFLLQVKVDLFKHEHYDLSIDDYIKRRLDVIFSQIAQKTKETISRPKHGRFILIRKELIVGAIFTLAFCGVSGLMSQPAHAEAGYFPLCLEYNTKECIQANGVYNQVTITTGSTSTWELIYSGNYIMFQNESGHCLRGENAYANYIEVGGACNGSDANDLWYVTNYPQGRMYNLGATEQGGFNSYLGTWGDSSGTPVFADDVQSGYFWAWYYAAIN